MEFGMGNCLTHLDFGTEELLQILGFSSIFPSKRDGLLEFWKQTCQSKSSES